MHNVQRLPNVAEKLAQLILGGYDAMMSEFLSITLGAQARFERGDWPQVQLAMKSRLQVYETRAEQTANYAATICGDQLQQLTMWGEAKQAYAEQVHGHPNELITKTFYNSVFGAIFGHQQIRRAHIFILDSAESVTAPGSAITRHSSSEQGFDDLFRKMLGYFSFSIPYQNAERDIANIVAVFEKRRPGLTATRQCDVEFGSSVFYRNKGAYIIGCIRGGGLEIPFALALLNSGDDSIAIDAVILGYDQLSMLFSFTRAHFMLDTDRPVDYVDYLQQLMPNKKRFELFNAIGFSKHAKTEFYRFKVDFTQQLPARSQYTVAPGIRGMVMLVFTLEESDYVYKVIRDRFTPPKNVSRQQVIEKYDMVRNSDRAGRLADTQEFYYLAFDRSRFSDELLEELLTEAGSSVEINGNALVFKHIYVERKMTPLNLYLRDASPEQIDSVMDEYGSAIKQLAAANIFPGDMLLKNFGVTRHGRVVFYDYDEICELVDCRFCELPESDLDDPLSSSPSYDVEDDDIFPEQFRMFFSGNRAAKKSFENVHSDIYQADFWRKLQNNINDGLLPDVFPYRRAWRFDNSRTGG